MKKILINFSVFCVAAISLWSCGSKNEEGRLIPSTAMMAAVLELNSLNKELTWDEIQKAGWYQVSASSSELPEWTKNVLANPAETGIDFNKNLVFFANKTADGKLYWAAEGRLKNQRDFDQFNKQYSNAGEIKKTGTVSILQLSANQLIGWNDNHFIYLSNDRPDPSSFTDTLHHPLTAGEMIDECNRLFNLDKKSNLSQNKHFSTLLKESGHIKVWVNGEEIMKDNPASGIGNLLNTDVFFNDNTATFNISFNNGEINIHQRQYASEKFTDFLKKNTGSGIEKDMLKKIPPGDLLALLAIDLKPEAFQNLIKLSGADGFANMFLQKAGFNLDDITRAIDGNVLLAVSAGNIPADAHLDDTSGNRLPFYGIFALGVKDQPAFKKIYNGASGLLSNLSADSHMHHHLTEKYMVISNAESYANQFLDNQPRTDLNFLQNTDHPLLGFINLQKIMSFAKKSANNSLQEEEMILHSLQMWDNLQFSGGEIKKDGVEINYKVHLMDKNTNSLKQLNKYIYSLQNIKDLNKKSGPGRNIDSLLTPPLPDTVRITDTTR